MRMLTGVAVIVAVSPLNTFADTITVSGVALQVSPPVGRGSTSQATLQEPADVTFAGNRYPLQKGAFVGWWNSSKDLARGVLRETVTFTIGGRTWNFAPGSEFALSRQPGANQLLSVRLPAFEEYDVAGRKVKVIEVRFNEKGDVETLDIGGPVKLVVDGAEQDVSGRVFVTADLKNVSKTLDGLKAFAAAAPSPTPAAPPTTANAPAPAPAPAPAAPALTPAPPRAKQRMGLGR